MAINKGYWIQGIQFNTLAEYVAVRKIQKNFSLQEHLRLDERTKTDITSEEVLKKFTPESTIRIAWDIIQPMTLKVAKRRYKKDIDKIKLIKDLLEGNIIWDTERQQGERL